jgi:hypothetical protein
MHEDNNMLEQACKIIEHISSRLKLHLAPSPATQWAGGSRWPKDVNAALTTWYYEHQATLDRMGYGLDLILARSGFCPVGIINDVSKLDYVRNSPVIKLTNYELIA